VAAVLPPNAEHVADKAPKARVVVGIGEEIGPVIQTTACKEQAFSKGAVNEAIDVRAVVKT
jgi:hypothetical protein